MVPCYVGPSHWCSGLKHSPLCQCSCPPGVCTPVSPDPILAGDMMKRPNLACRFEGGGLSWQGRFLICTAAPWVLELQSGQLVYLSCNVQLNKNNTLHHCQNSQCLQGSNCWSHASFSAELRYSPAKKLMAEATLCLTSEMLCRKRHFYGEVYTGML